MSERTQIISYLRTEYIGKSADKLLKDFPNRTIRILFPKMPYTQNFCRDRINVVVENGIIKKIWMG